MKSKNLLLVAAVAAAVAQTINALPLVSVSPTAKVQSIVSNGVTVNDTDSVLVMGNSGSTSMTQVGLPPVSSASTEWTTWDTGTTAGIRVDSNLHLGNGGGYVQNFVDFQFTLTQPALFTIAGNLLWGANDFYVEALSQALVFRDTEASPNYVWRELDFLRSNLQPGVALNNLNESRGAGGDLSPFEPGYDVASRIDPVTFLLAPDTYQIFWNQRILEGGSRGLLSPNASDFTAVGFVEFTLEVPGENRVPETSATVMLLGAGMVGLAFAGRRFGQQNA